MILPRIVVCSLTVALALGAADLRFEEGQRRLTEGKYAEAVETFKTVLHSNEKLPDSPFIGVVLDELAIAYRELGNFPEAERALNRAQAIFKGSAVEDPAATRLTVHLAELYMAENRRPDAEKLLRQSAAHLRSSSGSRADLAQAYNDLAVVCAVQGKRREAEKLLRQALSLLEVEFGSDNPILSSSLDPLAALLVSEHRYTEAVEPAERAFRFLQGGVPPDRASALLVIAKVYAHTGRVAEAETDAAEAVALVESLYGPAHQRVAVYLKCYADVLMQADRKQQAKDLNKRANAILAQWAQNTTRAYTVNVNALR